MKHSTPTEYLSTTNNLAPAGLQSSFKKNYRVWKDAHKEFGITGRGIEWTIKDGIPYRVPLLMKEVKEMMDQGRAERAIKK